MANLIDVIDQRAKMAVGKDPEGTIIQAYITTVRVQPRGSTRTIMCDCTEVSFQLVGKRCTYRSVPGSRTKYVVSAVFDAPHQTDVNQQGTQSNDHTLHDNIGGEIHRIVEKVIPVDNDEVIINDSEDSWRPKKVKMSNISGNSSTRWEPLIFDDDIVIFDHDIVMVEVEI